MLVIVNNDTPAESISTYIDTHPKSFNPNALHVSDCAKNFIEKSNFAFQLNYLSASPINKNHLDVLMEF